MKRYQVEECDVLRIKRFRKEFKNPKLRANPELIRAASLEIDGQDIFFTYTKTRFGGFRSWFLCPRCGKRAYKLYIPPFSDCLACRRCQNLVYEVQMKAKNKGYVLVRSRKAQEKYFKTRVTSKKFEKRRDNWLFWLGKRKEYFAELSREMNAHIVSLTSQIPGCKEDSFEDFHVTTRREGSPKRPEQLIGMCSKLGWW